MADSYTEGHVSHDVKIETKYDEKGLDRNPLVYSGEQGAGRQAFAPVSVVGCLPHSTGDVAAKSSGSVHLGYIGDHHKSHEPGHQNEHTSRADGTAFSTAKTSYPTSSPPNIQLFGGSELKMSHEDNSDAGSISSKTMPDNRKRAINFLQCWDLQIPPWLLDKSIPLDLNRVRRYTDFMDVPAPAWIARSNLVDSHETLRDQSTLAQSYQPRLATKREFKFYYDSAFNPMQGTAYPQVEDNVKNGGSTQNLWADAEIRRDGATTDIVCEPLQCDNPTLVTGSSSQAVTQSRQRIPAISTVAKAEPHKSATLNETQERIDTTPTQHWTAQNTDRNPLTASKIVHKLSCQPSRAHEKEPEVSNGDIRLQNTSKRCSKINVRFSSFNILDPIGSLKALECEFDIYDINDPKDQLCTLKEQAGERLWRRYLTCKRDSAVSYPSFRDFLLKTLKQTYNCLKTKNVSSLDEFEEVWAAIQDSPAEAKDRHFLLQLLNPTEQTTINSHPNDSLAESAERVRALIRSRTLFTTQQGTYGASGASGRNARFDNSYGRNYSYSRQRGKWRPQHYQKNAIPLTQRVILPANNNSAHICYYHQRFKHNAFSCEGPPCSKYMNQRIVQPLDTGTDNVQREANLAVQESRTFVNQENFEPRATQ